MWRTWLSTNALTMPVDGSVGRGLAKTLCFLPNFVLEAQDFALELVPFLARIQAQQMQIESHLLAGGAEIGERILEIDG